LVGPLSGWATFVVFVALLKLCLMAPTIGVAIWEVVIHRIVAIVVIAAAN
jgi:hypothetical protein